MDDKLSVLSIDAGSRPCEALLTDEFFWKRYYHTFGFPMFRLLLVLSLLLFFSLPAFAAKDEARMAELLSQAEQGDTKALTTLQEKAETGSAIAEHNLGEFYFRTGGKSSDSAASAAKWYRKAANQGYSMSQYQLGYLYAEGRGVQQSDSEAYFWFSLAAAAPHGVFADSKTKPFIEEVQDRAAKKLTLQQRKSVERRVRSWKPHAAAAK